MRIIAVADGIYRDTITGTFYQRPWIRGRRTWRKLEGHTLRLAKESLAQRQADRTRAKLGLARDPFARKAPQVSELLSAWEPAHARERSQIKALKEHWRDCDSDKIELPMDAHRYAKIRQKAAGGQIGRAIDLELSTLRNVLRGAIAAGKLRGMPTGDWPKFRLPVIRHCREVAPRTVDHLHDLAAHLFASQQSEVLGWQVLLSAMTGCRTSEVLRLRWDAASMRDAGFVDGKYLWLQRSKNGINPYARIHEGLAACLDALRKWRASRPRAAASPWFLPGRDATQSAEIQSLSHALARVATKLIGYPVTPHGLRSYYVTTRRGQGIADAQIAAEIGDASGAAIVVQTYGSVPPEWGGTEGLGWLPKGKPAWSTFG